MASKVGLTEDNRVDLSKKSIISSCESSLMKLKTDYLDIYQVHYHDPNTPISETIEALESLKREGKIRYYGIGHLPLDKTEEYLKLGNVSFVLAEMSPVNICRYRELYFLQAEYNFNIIAFSITGRGLLSGVIHTNTKFKENDIRSTDPLFKKSRLSSGIRIKEKLEKVGKRYGLTPVQASILWTIQKPGVLIGLTGPVNKKHLFENSKALNCSLDKEAMNEIDEFIEAEVKRLNNLVAEEINHILNSSSLSKFEETCDDIIYVIEHCIENRLIVYEDGVNMYEKVMEVKNSGNKSLIEIDNIKEKIKAGIVAMM